MTQTIDEAAPAALFDRLPESMTPAQIERMIDLFLEDTLGEAPAAERGVAAAIFPPASGYKPGDTLGTAVLAGNFEDGSPEWHAQRAGGIGGSEIASVLHLSNWKSRYVLWLEKVGTIQPEPIDPMFAEWGHRLEPAVLQKYQDSRPHLRLTAGGSWVHKDRPWHKANPDGLAFDEAGNLVEIVECKTSMNGFGWGEESEGVDGVPRKYVAQVRWYMAAFGATRATIIVLIGLGDYREYTILADPFETLHMVNEGKAFMDLVNSQTAPEIDGGKDTYEYLRTVNPSIDPKLDVELNEEIASMVIAAKAGYEAAETELTRAKGHLLAHMGIAKRAKYKGKDLAAREARGGGVPFIKLK